MSLVVKTDDQWVNDFDGMMRRLWKWWPCSVSNPNETPEQQMERMRACMHERGVPDALPPSDEDEIVRDIDDLIDQTNRAPETVDPKAVMEFQSALGAILEKLG